MYNKKIKYKNLQIKKVNEVKKVKKAKKIKIIKKIIKLILKNNNKSIKKL